MLSALTLRLYCPYAADLQSEAPAYSWFSLHGNLPFMWGAFYSGAGPIGVARNASPHDIYESKDKGGEKGAIVN